MLVPRTFSGLLTTLFVVLLVLPVQAQEPVDADVVAAIRKHGLEQSQVMDILSWLTDVHGPRLTGSPGLDSAAQWAADELASWGLKNAHLEPWGPFGRGWTLNRFSMQATSPAVFPVHAYPKAWSGSTNGPVEAEVVIFNPGPDEDLARYRGQLNGKIVLIEGVREVEEPFEPLAQRRDAENLLELANAAGQDVREFRYDADRLREMRLRQQRFQFLYDEQPAAILDRSYKGDYGTIFVSGASVPAPADAGWRDRPSAYDLDAGDVIPQVTVAVEHYNRLYRLVEKGFPVRVMLELDASYHAEDPMEYNVVAEIPGTDPAIGDELVMVGAHLDSWHAGTGTTDNGAGSAVMMEAMRILQQVFQETGKQPRRTIRIALWTGEEQGLHGSRAYVNDHFAEIGGWGEPPRSLKPGHDKLSAYYNLDNGTGKIRGVYLQGNADVAPIFRAWMAPFHDLGAGTLTISNTSGTDHLSFDAVGLPGFQFIQEPIAYSTRTHHSNMDLYDHAIADDLKQAATIIASFVYHTAMRNEKLPRKVLEIAEEETTVGSN